MNLKSTLWTLAFACAAVSCSDDLNEGPNGGNQGNGVDGEKTFMNVTISPGVTTRATGGEEGDNTSDDQEIGESNEYKVDNVTVILYTDKDGNTPTSFTHDCKLVAAGFANTPAMSVDDENWHNRQTSVEITITDSNESNFDNKTYGVITVTNLANAAALKDRINSEDINTGAELANVLQTSEWSGSGASATKFVMSTHNDTYTGSAALFDQVTLKANATSDNAPTADVHVERLAAKIRMSATENITDFIYSIGSGSNVTAKVRLDNVAIVNQLTSGTYTLKRVTPAVTATDGTIPAIGTDGDNYLGNETATNGAGTNYVIDPWTRNKNEDGLASLTTKDAIATAGVTTTAGQTITLNYANDFEGENYATMWAGLTGAVELSNSTAFENGANVLLTYTRENTTSAAMSRNGYSTGALFKATYFPKQYSAVTKETVDGKEKDVVKPIDIDYNGTDVEGTGFDAISKNTTTDVDFYVYQGNVYKDYEAIFNEFAWRQQQPLEGGTKDIYSLSDFNSKESIEKIKVADFLQSLLAEASDPFGYIDAIKKKYMDQYDKDNNGSLSEEELTTIADTKLAEADMFSTWSAVADNKAAIEANINTYEDCVCYYPYWIRHADNKKATEMGIMEFGIVRNNIYDLAVSQIKTLGLSGIDKPNPKDPDESKTLRFVVRILVKNWVVRSNSGIIL